MYKGTYTHMYLRIGELRCAQDLENQRYGVY
jgi:hypothetical protein